MHFATGIRAIAIILFASCVISCERRVETDPPGFPADPFLDAFTYQEALNLTSPGEWSVVAFHKTEQNPDNHKYEGITLALSKHRTREEFLYLYHFPPRPQRGCLFG